MAAATVAQPAAHDVEWSVEGLFAQLAPQPGHVPAALPKPLVKLLRVRIDDAGPRTSLRFGGRCPL
ncbi:MAG: hypothetical protein HIU93_12270 [Acidobacteria bacterium]|nr:hypothetical protein [Acidobacteriota bacterium]